MRYVHDELGSRIRFSRQGGPPPGFQLAPFLWRHDGGQEALSILWPIRWAASLHDLPLSLGFVIFQHPCSAPIHNSLEASFLQRVSPAGSMLIACMAHQAYCHVCVAADSVWYRVDTETSLLFTQSRRDE